LRAIESFKLKQRLGDHFELVAMSDEQFLRARIGVVN
jgi:hypothetical protein